MVAEAIKQSEIEAEKSEEKKQTGIFKQNESVFYLYILPLETKDSPPPNKKAPKSVSRQMREFFDITLNIITKN